MDRRTVVCVILLVSVISCSALLAGSGSSLPYVGQLASNYAFVDGVSVPQGTTVFTDSLVSTRGQAATLHLRNGAVVKLAANSSAFFELKAPQQVQVAVKSGSIRYGTGSGRFLSAASPTQLVLAQAQSGQPILSNTGVVGVLLEAAAAGSSVLHVNDTSNLEQDGRLLIKSADGSKYEVRYITRIQGNYIYLDAPLTNAYSPQDPLIQGCECDRALGLPDDGILGLISEEVPKGSRTIKFTARAPLDPKAKLMIKRRDGSVRELHSIASFDGVDTVTLADGLENSFEPGDMLVQGCQVKPVVGSFPVMKTALLGAAAGAGGTAAAMTLLEECSPCVPTQTKVP